VPASSSSSIWGARPRIFELAGEAGITVQDLRETLSQLSSSTILTLDGLWAVSDASGDQIALVDTLRDEDSADPLEHLAAEELHDELAHALGMLTERERLVVGLYHYYNLTLREIGDVISVSDSRVSQPHSRAMLRLRGWLTAAAHGEAELALAA